MIYSTPFITYNVLFIILKKPYYIENLVFRITFGGTQPQLTFFLGGGNCSNKIEYNLTS